MPEREVRAPITLTSKDIARLGAADASACSVTTLRRYAAGGAELELRTVRWIDQWMEKLKIPRVPRKTVNDGDHGRP